MTYEMVPCLMKRMAEKTDNKLTDKEVERVNKLRKLFMDSVKADGYIISNLDQDSWIIKRT